MNVYISVNNYLFIYNPDMLLHTSTNSILMAYNKGHITLQF